MSSIGMIGSGMMGAAMVRRLRSGNLGVMVWNRTREKALPLQAHGAVIADSLEHLASSQQIILSMLSTSDVVSEIAGTIRSAAAPGTIHADMSTIAPGTSAACEAAAASSGMHFVHAPVLGSVPQVDDGKLLIFAGGKDRAIEQLAPAFGMMSSTVFRFGSAAEASHMKLTCNFFIASMIMTLGQGLRFATAAGLDGSVLLDVLGRSALAAPMFASKGASILAQNFSPRFFLDHMLKDVRLFRDAARELGLDPQAGELLEDSFRKASAAGLGKSDYSSVTTIL